MGGSPPLPGLFLGSRFPSTLGAPPATPLVDGAGVCLRRLPGAVTRGPPGPGRAESRGPRVPSQTPRGPRGGLAKSPRVEGGVSGFGGKSGPVVWSRCCGQPPSWLSPTGLEGAAAASGLGAFPQPRVPAGPGPEAVPRAERVHGQPGHLQQLPRQLVPAVEEAGAGGSDDGECRRGLGRGLRARAG